ncbi:MAG TPA: hypothetical protein VEJ84_16165 [Acidimicrobiales bacterium]|nr:hypothetical protein [Acidimicrobiales bacterium]
MTVLVIATGMAYTLWWPAVVRHHASYWVEPGDIWGTVRAAHWIAWGGFSFIYSSGTGLVTLPGFHLLLTPFVMLSSALHLSETAPGFVPQLKPTAWLLIGPVTLVCSAAPLFAFDALARELRISVGRRRLLSLLEAAAVWPALALWGHPEDVLALGLAVLCLVQMQRGHWWAVGWLLGAAIAMQLYVIALVPLFCFTAGLRRSPALLARAALLPGFLFLVVVIPNPHASLHALLDQPNYPRIDYPTPWVLLAPKIGRGVVAAGPGRIIGLLVATACGALASRHRQNLGWLTWLMAAALATRCCFESVMDPYYWGPVIAVTLCAAATVPLYRWMMAAAALGGLTYLSYQRTGIWPYWLETSALIVFALVVALPLHRRRAPDEAPAGTSTSIRLSSAVPALTSSS